jgi:hypothetical protein
VDTRPQNIFLYCVPIRIEIRCENLLTVSRKATGFSVYFIALFCKLAAFYLLLGRLQRLLLLKAIVCESHVVNGASNKNI